MEVIAEHLAIAQELFSRSVAQRGTRPLRDGIEIALYLDGKGPIKLTKVNGSATVLNEAPSRPDMTFWVPEKALHALAASTTEDIGELGVEIVKLMAHSDEANRIVAKVHIGPFDLLRNGYLGVIPLGGPTFMKHLTSLGLTGVGKIKDAITKLRT